MKLFAHPLLVLAITVLCAISNPWHSINNPRTAALDEDQPAPCVCTCGGQIQCEKGQWSFCKCENGKCKGACSTGKKAPLPLAADVLSPIFEKSLSEADLRKEPQQYSPVLGELLRSKVSPGKYKYRQIGFSFIPQIESQLNVAFNELEKLRVEIPDRRAQLDGAYHRPHSSEYVRQ